MILDNYEYMPVVRNNALHGLALIKMTVARFVGTGSFLIRYKYITN
jgi:hypothetical protein